MRLHNALSNKLLAWTKRKLSFNTDYMRRIEDALILEQGKTRKFVKEREQLQKDNQDLKDELRHASDTVDYPTCKVCLTVSPGFYKNYFLVTFSKKILFQGNFTCSF